MIKLHHGDCLDIMREMAIACMQTDRQFIGIEKDAGYFDASMQRVETERIRHKQIELFKGLPN